MKGRHIERVSTGTAAKWLSISQRGVRYLIEEGVLDAIDVSRPEARRRTLRVSVSSIETEMARRGATVAGGQKTGITGNSSE